MNINLHIEQLILDGVNIAPGQSQALRASVANELSRMLWDGGLSPSLVQGSALPRLSASGIQVTSNNPKHLGQQIAQSVYGGIGHE